MRNNISIPSSAFCCWIMYLFTFYANDSCVRGATPYTSAIPLYVLLHAFFNWSYSCVAAEVQHRFIREFRRQLLALES